MTRVHFRIALLFGIGALLIVKGQGTWAAPPPLEQLPLRDALLAAPEVVASLSATARQQLAQRFEVARQHPAGTLHAPPITTTGAVDAVRAIDEARLGERSDAMISGFYFNSPADVDVQPYSEDPGDSADAQPPLDWVGAGPTADAERSALAGRAGAIVRRLLHLGEGHRLMRVVSWPIGAIEIDSVVYVNAAWLVALSPDSDINPPPPTKSLSVNAAEPGCGGGMAVSTSSGGGLEGQKGVQLSDEGTATDKKAADSHATDSQTDSTASGHGLPELQKIYGDGSGTADSATSHTTTQSEGSLHAEAAPPDQTYSADTTGLVNPADCCRDPNACGGPDSSCAANASVCADPNSTCNTANCNDNSTCSNNSCNNNSCSTGSCSTGSCSTGSCSTGSCSSGGCSSGSGCSSSGGSSGCSSSSSSCGGSSGGSSGSCGGSSGGSSSSCNFGKCAMAPPPIIRRPGDIPDVATFGILLIPLWYLVRQGRRRQQA